MKKLFFIICIFVGLFTYDVFASGGGESGENINLRLAHAMAPDHPVSVAIDRLAKEVAEASNGRITITVYGNAQLGDERSLIEQVQKGGIDMVKLGASVLENFVSVYGTLSMPYLYRNEDHFYAFIKGDVGREFLDLLEDAGLKGLTFYTAGSRNFYATKQIVSPSDLKGLKIRTRPSNTEIAMVEAMGGAATPIAFGELYSALQQGVVDGAENNVSSYVTTRHMEIAKFFSFDRHSMVPDLLAMNKQKFDSLSESDRALLMDLINKSLEYQIGLWNQAEIDNQKKAEDQGSTFKEVDSQAFMDAVQPLYDELNPDRKAWVEKIRAVK